MAVEKVKSNPVNDKKQMTKAELERYSQKMKAYDEELLVGIFENKENPGCSLDFCFKGQWKGSSFDRYTLFDGHRYQLPRAVVRHLNKDCAVPVYKEIGKNALAMPVNRSVNETLLSGRYEVQSQIVEKRNRFRFVPLDFMEDDIHPDRIALVETTVRG